jgi:nickel superoxide dismutase
MKKLKIIVILSVFLISPFVNNQSLYAHCEIPCGIYEDSLRASLISEHITTIEKSMKMIIKISEEANPNYNQLVRWVTNKEEHAKKIQEIVSQYFLHQRVKITDSSDKEKYAKYVNLLTTLHEISVYAMKAKQSTDLTNIEKLKSSLDAFRKVYFHSH